jgi:hypothetical protein
MTKLLLLLAALLLIAAVGGFAVERYIVTVICIPVAFVLVQIAARREGDGM